MKGMMKPASGAAFQRFTLQKCVAPPARSPYIGELSRVAENSRLLTGLSGGRKKQGPAEDPLFRRGSRERHVGRTVMKKWIGVALCLLPLSVRAEQTYTNEDLRKFTVPGAYTNEDLKKLPRLPVVRGAPLPPAPI